MTGVVVRIQRGERFLNLDFDELTDDEMRGFLLEKTANGQHGWISGLAVILAVWIRDNVRGGPDGNGTG